MVWMYAYVLFLCGLLRLDPVWAREDLEDLSIEGAIERGEESMFS
jgi:hypothetical protein